MRVQLVTTVPHCILLWTVVGLASGLVLPFVAGVSSTKSKKVHIMVDALIVEGKDLRI